MFVPPLFNAAIQLSAEHYSLIIANQTGIILSPVEKILLFFRMLNYIIYPF